MKNNLVALKSKEGGIEGFVVSQIPSREMNPIVIRELPKHTLDAHVYSVEHALVVVLEVFLVRVLRVLVPAVVYFEELIAVPELFVVSLDCPRF